MIQKQKPEQYIGFTWQGLCFCFPLIWILKDYTFVVYIPKQSLWYCQWKKNEMGEILPAFSLLLLHASKMSKYISVGTYFSAWFYSAFIIICVCVCVPVLPEFLKTGWIQYYSSKFFLDDSSAIVFRGESSKYIKKAWNLEWVGQRVVWFNRSSSSSFSSAFIMASLWSLMWHQNQSTLSFFFSLVPFRIRWDTGIFIS